MKILLREGQRIPKYYGVAYRNWDMLTVACYPIPLNVGIAFLRKALFWFKYGHKLYDDGYTKGYVKGEREGRDYAFNQYKVQALQQEIGLIVKNYLEEYSRIIRLSEDAQKGWILKFIDDETKRIQSISDLRHVG